MFWCNVLVVLAPLLAGDRAVSSDDRAAKELQRFQGSWKAVSVQMPDGRQATKEEVEATRLVVEGNKFTLTGAQSVTSGIFTINAASTPRTIDVFITSKDGHTSKLLGIYQIEGDTRKSCFALPEKLRPTKFLSEKGYIGFEWKRN